jgi:ABC-type bacteriocin/lantibiotic exporter with double-glycine peptidase domain
MFQPLAFKAGRGPTLAQQRADQLLHDYVRARRDHFRILLRQIGGLLLIQALASAALLGIGGALVIGRQLTIGQLVASVSGVVAALAKFGKHLESLYDLLASLDKLGHLLDIELEPIDNPLRPPPRTPDSGEPGMAVVFHRVSLAYPGQPTLLANINLRIEPGECAAIVAPAGTGKSLLSAALYGLLPVRHGFLELDGMSLRDVYLPALRQHVVLLRGDASEIFTGTLEENIVCGRGEASASELRRVLNTVGLWDELQSEPQGLRRYIQSGGTILSQLQRQRLLAARALLMKPRLLLIDGAALAHVERESDWLIELLKEPQRPTVILFLPPGSPLLASCQRVFTISEGQVLPLLPGSSQRAEGGADVSRSL